MSRILIIHSGLSGISNACLEISKRLKADGHQVWLSAMKDESIKAEKNDLDYLSTNPIRFNYTELRTKQSQLKSSKFYDQIEAELNFKNFEQKLKSKEIDLVLIDLELHEYILYLFAQKFPMMIICQWFSIWRTEDNIPPFMNRVPSSAFSQKLLWTYSNIRGRLKTILNRLKTKGINRRAFILHWYKKLGLKADILVPYHFPLPFSYRDIPTLICTHPALEFKPSALSHHHYVYPMVCAERAEPMEDSFSRDFKKILSLRDSQHKKIILVTRSSMDKSDREILPRLLESLKTEENCISIVSLGKWYDSFKSYHNSENLFLYSSVPQLKVLQEANLSINHGGIHTINECIHFKVPMLIISGDRFDQNGCAARVAHQGCGISLYKNNSSKEALKQAVNLLLNEQSYQKKMNHLHDTYRNAKKERVLEVLIKNHIEDSMID